MIFNAVKLESKPKVILRNLREANLIDEENSPTSQQLDNKIASCRRIANHLSHIFSTHELRQAIAKVFEIPESDVEAFSEVDDADEKEEPLFSIIWTSKKLMARVDEKFLQNDATYRLTYQVVNFYLKYYLTG